MAEVLQIDPKQFLEEVMGLILGCQKIPYTSFSTYQARLGFSNLNDIVSVILNYFEIISTKYERHIHEVYFALSKNFKSGEYLQLVGKRLLLDKKFEWKYFRVFLALVFKLSDLCYKKELVHLSYNIMISTAKFIEDNLQRPINGLRGWTNFEDDCRAFCIMIRGLQEENKERVAKPPKPPKRPKRPKILATSTSTVEVHTSTFNAGTFGKCLVYKPPEENYIEPILSLRLTWQDLQLVMTASVTEVIEISASALEVTYNMSSEA